MPSVGSITKTIRLSPEDRELVERTMAENSLTWSGAIHHLITGMNATKVVVTEDAAFNKEDIFQEIMDKAVYREINKLCKANRISTHDFYRGVMNLWERGKLAIDRDRVISKGEYNMDEFIECCHYMNEYPQKVIDKIVKGLKS